MQPSLRDFLGMLDAAGELLRVKAPVSPVLELAAIADRVSKLDAPHAPSGSARRTDPRFAALGGPALLFENVEGSEHPVLINAFGSYRRMEMALGCHEAGHGVSAGPRAGGFEAIASMIAALVKPEPPRSIGELLETAQRFAPLLRVPPRRVRGRGDCQEIILTGDAVDLTQLPILRCWPHDGDFAALGYPASVNDGIPGLGAGEAWNARYRGRYITLAGIHTIHADDSASEKPSSHNIGMYRVQLLGPRRLAMHWHMHHDGARHWRSWKKRGEPMPVAVALGGESILPYAATAPLPPGISELLLAGFLNGSGIPLVRGVTVPLWLPANAEIVIEGYVRTDAGFIDFDPRRDGDIGPGAVFEGPFGDHTGFYSLPDRYPVLEVTAITMRHRPIYPTTVVGLPPQEDYFLGKATERIFLPLLRTILPDIEDYDLPLFGAFHNAACVQIRKSYPLHARRVMHGIWGAGQMSWTKTIFIVDDSVDVHDIRAVLAAAGRHCRPDRDLETVHGPLDILDHAAPYLGAGTKLGFDCTPKIEGEQAGTSDLAPRPSTVDMESLLSEIRGMPGVLDAALAFGLSEWLMVSLQKTRGGEGREFIDRLFALPRNLPAFIIVVGEEAGAANADRALFHWCAHADAGRDMVIRRQAWHAPSAAFDATPKMRGDGRPGAPVRTWPPVLRLDAATKERVESRWREYGLPGQCPAEW